MLDSANLSVLNTVRNTLSDSIDSYAHYFDSNVLLAFENLIECLDEQIDGTEG